MILDKLAQKFGTDKSSRHHNYTKCYEMLFSSLRDKDINLLEIGVFRGASLKMWKSYFQNGKIYGLDINPDCKKLEEENIQIFIGNQSDTNCLNSIKESVPVGFDILIDDGGHTSRQQISTFENMFGCVKAGGWYVIEDLHTSYIERFNRGSSVSALQYFSTLIGDVNLNGKSLKRSKYGILKKLKRRKVELSFKEELIEAVIFFPSICLVKKI